MGVSGCGKTTIGTCLAHTFGMRFVDGDDLHPLQNLDKMSAGIPLEDSDRLPWLEEIGRVLDSGAAQVIAASCLRRKYRDAVRSIAEDVVFIHLALTYEQSYARVSNRPGHFMPASLVKNQFDILEPLSPEEAGLTLNAMDSTDSNVEIIAAFLKSKGEPT